MPYHHIIPNMFDSQYDFPFMEMFSKTITNQNKCFWEIIKCQSLYFSSGHRVIDELLT